MFIYNIINFNPQYINNLENIYGTSLEDISIEAAESKLFRLTPARGDNVDPLYERFRREFNGKVFSSPTGDLIKWFEVKKVLREGAPAEQFEETQQEESQAAPPAQQTLADVLYGPETQQQPAPEGSGRRRRRRA